MRKWLSLLTLCSLLLPACESVDCDPAQASACPSMQACLKIGEDQGGPANRCRPVDPNGKVKCTMVGKVDECTADAPICGPNKVCATCQDFAMPDDACKTASATKPYCKLAANVSPALCVSCRGNKAASEGCSGANPVCDASNKCVPCTAHDDCKLAAGGTGICKLAEYSLPDSGACASDNEIRVVTTAGQLNTAINDAAGPKFILARAGTYDPIVVTNAVDKIVIGAGRDAASPSKISADGVSASLRFTTTGRVILDGLRFAGFLNCTFNSDMVVLRSVVDVTGQVNGITAADSDCRSLTVGHSAVVNVSKTGILIGGGTDYKIFNTLVLDTATAAGSAAVSINSNRGYFAFNTITRNANGGVLCGSQSGMPALNSSIIQNNGQAGMMDGMGKGASQVGSKCVLKDVVLGIMAPLPSGVLSGTASFAGSGQEATDYKLRDSNQACCSLKTVVDPQVPVDYFGNRRGRQGTNKTDVGFHEFP